MKRTEWKVSSAQVASAMEVLIESIAPGLGIGEKVATIFKAATELGETIDSTVPDGPDKDRALDLLGEAVGACSAGIVAALDKVQE